MSDSTRTGLPAMHGGTGAAPVTRDTGAETSLGAALSAVTRDISTLMQQEVALAKAEVRQSVNRAAQSVGMFAGAAVAAFLVVLFISVALWWAIGDSTGLGWAALIVAGVWAVAGAVLYLLAKKQLERIDGLEQTTDTLAKVPNALKGQEERNR